MIGSNPEKTMRHFVGYHNREGMGYPANTHDPLSIHTNRSVEHLKGGLVWLVEGEQGEQRKRFTLCAVFLVDETGSSDHAGFTNVARGRGREFQSPPLLNELDWFPEFFEWSGHFGRGVPEITEQRHLDGLIQLLVTSS
jgi:hypothetical protein